MDGVYCLYETVHILNRMIILLYTYICITVIRVRPYVNKQVFLNFCILIE